MLNENSRILVHGVGYVKIKDIQLEEFEVWDGEDYVVSKLDTSESKTCCKISFYGGNFITCSAEHKFFAQMSNTKADWIEAKNLTNKHRILLVEETPKFDFFPTNEYKLLGKLPSLLLGVLLGTEYLFGDTEIISVPKLKINQPRMITFTIPESDRDLKRTLIEIFKELDVKYQVGEIYRSSSNLTTIDVKGEDFLEELTSLSLRNGFVEPLWTSKPLLEGILKVFFDYSKKSPEMFELYLDETKLFKDVQQALFLFGVVSSVTRGLRKSRLTVMKKNSYRFCKKVGLIKPEKVLDVVEYSKLKKFRDVETLKVQVSEIGLTPCVSSMYDVKNNNVHKFVVNGLVTQ